MIHFQIICGGTPTPTAERFGTCFLARIEEDALLFDCGPAATWKMVHCGISPTLVTHLFLTHHHFDHNADLPCFVLCRWDQGAGRIPLLRVRGPEPTTHTLEALFGSGGVFQPDIRARIEDPGSQSVFVNRGGTLPRRPPEFDCSDIGEGFTMEEDSWRITAARARHADPWLETLSYKIETRETTLGIISDTQPCPAVSHLMRGVQTLVANCWDIQDAMESSGEWDGQTGTLDAARMAAEAGSDHLILSHMGPNLCRPEVQASALEGMRNLYRGRITFASEGDAWNL